MARVVVHQAEMDALLNSPAGGIAKDLMRRARLVEARAKDLARVDTGRMRASVTTVPTVVDGELAVQIGTNVLYAKFYADEFLQPALAAAFT